MLGQSSRANETRRMLLAVATPMHMIAPISAGTLSVVREETEIARCLPTPLAGL